jgi:hypothetical protein
MSAEIDKKNRATTSKSLKMKKRKNTSRGVKRRALPKAGLLLVLPCFTRFHDFEMFDLFCKCLRIPPRGGSTRELARGRGPRRALVEALPRREPLQGVHMQSIPDNPYL